MPAFRSRHYRPFSRSGLNFLGGLALMPGLLTRATAAILAFNMAVAVLAVHLKGGFFLPAGIELRSRCWRADDHGRNSAG